MNPNHPGPHGSTPPPTGPDFDADGHPTTETLDRIRTWPMNQPGLWEYVRQCWRYHEGFLREPNRLTLITFGWSGNESIVQALRENSLLHSACWQSSHRGGLHEYNVLHELWPDSQLCSSPAKTQEEGRA